MSNNCDDNGITPVEKTVKSPTPAKEFQEIQQKVTGTKKEIRTLGSMGSPSSKGLPELENLPSQSKKEEESSFTDQNHSQKSEERFFSPYDYVDKTEIDTNPAINHGERSEVDTDPGINHPDRVEVDTTPSESTTQKLEVGTDPGVNHLEKTEVSADPGINHSEKTEVGAAPSNTHNEKSEELVEVNGITLNSKGEPVVEMPESRDGKTETGISLQDQHDGKLEVDTDPGINHEGKDEIGTDPGINHESKSEVDTTPSNSLPEKQEIETDPYADHTEKTEISADPDTTASVKTEVDATPSNSHSEKSEVDATPSTSLPTKDEISTNPTINHGEKSEVEPGINTLMSGTTDKNLPSSGNFYTPNQEQENNSRVSDNTKNYTYDQVMADILLNLDSSVKQGEDYSIPKPDPTNTERVIDDSGIYDGSLLGVDGQAFLTGRYQKVHDSGSTQNNESYNSNVAPQNLNFSDASTFAENYDYSQVRSEYNFDAHTEGVREDNSAVAAPINISGFDRDRSTIDISDTDVTATNNNLLDTFAIRKNLKDPTLGDVPAHGNISIPSSDFIEANNATVLSSGYDHSKIFTEYSTTIEPGSKGIKLGDSGKDLYGADGLGRADATYGDTTSDMADGYTPIVDWLNLIPPREGILDVLGSVLQVTGLGDAIAIPDAKIDDMMNDDSSRILNRYVTRDAMKLVHSRLHNAVLMGTRPDDPTTPENEAELENASFGQGLSNFVSTVVNFLTGNPFKGMFADKLEMIKDGYFHGTMDNQINRSAGHIFSNNFKGGFFNYQNAIVRHAKNYIQEYSSSSADKISWMKGRQDVLTQRVNNDLTSEEDRTDAAFWIEKYGTKIKDLNASVKANERELGRFLIQIGPPSEYSAYLPESQRTGYQKNETQWNVDANRGTEGPKRKGQDDESNKLQGGKPSGSDITWRQTALTQKPDNPDDLEDWMNKGSKRQDLLDRRIASYEESQFSGVAKDMAEEEFTFQHMFFAYGDSYSSQIEKLVNLKSVASAKQPSDKTKFSSEADEVANYSNVLTSAHLEEVYQKHLLSPGATAAIIDITKLSKDANDESQTTKNKKEYFDPHFGVLEPEKTSQPNAKKTFYETLKSMDNEKFNGRVFSLYGTDTNDESSLLSPTSKIENNDSLPHISNIKSLADLDSVYYGDRKSYITINTNGSKDPHMREMVSAVVKGGFRETYYTSVLNKEDGKTGFSFGPVAGASDGDTQNIFSLDRTKLMGDYSYIADFKHPDLEKNNDLRYLATKEAFANKVSSQKKEGSGEEAQEMPLIREKYYASAGAGEDADAHTWTGIESEAAKNPIHRLVEPLKNIEKYTTEPAAADVKQITDTQSATAYAISGVASAETQLTTLKDRNVNKIPIALNSTATTTFSKETGAITQGEVEKLFDDDGNRIENDPSAAGYYKVIYNSKMKVYGQDDLTIKNRNVELSDGTSVSMEERYTDLGYISVNKNTYQNVVTSPSYFKIPFQYNAEITGETRRANWNTVTAFGRSSEHFVWSNSGSRQIQFKTTYMVMDGQAYDREGNEIDADYNKMYEWAKGWTEEYVMKILTRYKSLVLPKNQERGLCPPVIAIRSSKMMRTVSYDTNNDWETSRWIVEDYNIDPNYDAGFTETRTPRMWDVTLSLRETLRNWKDYQDVDLFAKLEDKIVE